MDVFRYYILIYYVIEYTVYVYEHKEWKRIHIKDDGHPLLFFSSPTLRISQND